MSRRRFRRWAPGNWFPATVLQGGPCGLLAGLGIANGQLCAAFRAAAGQDSPAVLRGHPRAETVLVGALAAARLVRALHRIWKINRVAARRIFGSRSYRRRRANKDTYAQSPTSHFRVNSVLTSSFPITYFTIRFSGSSSVGRASASQAEGREFESRFPLEGQVATPMLIGSVVLPRACPRCECCHIRGSNPVSRSKGKATL